MHAQAQSASGVNERVLRRLQSSSAQIIGLFAPAGYGKTALAQHFASRFDRVAWCDCAAVDSTQAFLDAVVSALALDGGRDMVFPQARLQMSYTDDEGAMRSIFENVWTKRTQPSLIVFENAERLARHSELTPLLYRLLVTAPSDRTVLVCSRDRLAIRSGRYLPPHRLLTITSADLTLTDEEARELIRNEQLPAEQEARIIHTARGWPVVLLVLARIAADGRLEEALQTAQSIEFDSIFEYLIDEVIAPLTPQERRILLLCSAIPNATEDDLSIILDSPASELRELLRNLPLIERFQSTYTVNPMLRQVLLHDDANGINEVRKLAERQESAGAYSRAATLFRGIGDEQRSARALAALPPNQLLLPENLLQLSRFPISVLSEHPQLAIAATYGTSWLVSAPGLPRAAAEMIQLGFERLDEDTHPDTIATVAWVLASALWYFGMNHRVWKLISDVRFQRALCSGSGLAHRLLHGISEAAETLDGKIESSFDNLQRAFSEALLHGIPGSAAPYAHRIAQTYRFRGDRVQALEWLDRSISLASEAKSPVMMLTYVLSGIVNAWFWDGDEATTRYTESLHACSNELEQRIDLGAVRIDALNQEIRIGPVLVQQVVGVELMLMKAARSSTDERASIFMNVETLLQDTTPFTQALYYIARACGQPDQREEYFVKARYAVERTEAYAFKDAIAACSGGRPSFLDSYVHHFTSFEQLPHAPSVSLELFAERILTDGKSMQLTARETAVLTYIARQRIASTREEMQDAIWPEQDERSARDSLYSLIYRLRRRVGSVDVIRNLGKAYAIADGVTVDIWEAERLSDDIRRSQCPPTESVREAYERVKNRSWLHLAAFDWFAVMDFRISECERTFLKYLVEVAEKQNQYTDVITYALSGLEADECDEWAYTVLIRAHRALGNRAEATRLYRRYCETLKRELNAEPAEELRALAT